MIHVACAYADIKTADQVLRSRADVCAVIGKRHVIAPRVDVVHIVAAHHAVGAVAAVTQAHAIETVERIFAFQHIITRHILVHESAHSSPGLREEKCFAKLTERFNSCMRIEFDFRLSALKFLFRDGLVEDVVLLLAQVDATDAILATDAIHEEP